MTDYDLKTGKVLLSTTPTGGLAPTVYDLKTGKVLLSTTPTPTPTPTPAPPLAPVTIPGLPWYLSWLTPLLEWIAACFGSFWDTLIGDETRSLVGKAIVGVAGRIFGDVTTQLEVIMQQASASTQTVLAQATAATEKSRAAPAAAGAAEAGPTDPWLAWQYLQHDGDFFGAALGAAEAGGLAAEIATLGQVEGTLTVARNVLNRFNYEEITKARYMLEYERRVLKPAERYLNQQYTPELPGVADLINMVVKEVLTVDQFLEVMKSSGISKEWSQRIWDAHWIQPSYGEIQRAYWYGDITDETLDHYLRYVDLDPRYDDVVWKPQLEQIPPYSELVNERVKEVIDQPTFEGALGMWGFRGKWAKNIWDAHFAPATWQDFLTAMRRKQTVVIPRVDRPATTHTFGADLGRDFEILQELSTLVDYDPRYWDFFKQRIYNDPSYRMVMWGFEAGAIDPTAVPDLVHRLGLRPEDEGWYTRFLMTFQERAWITKYITALATAYIKGVFNADELKKRVLAIPRNEAVANWIVKIADVRKEIASVKEVAGKEKLLSLGDLKAAFRENLVSSDVFMAECLERGYAVTDIELMILLIEKEKDVVEAGGKVTGLSVTELLNAWRYGVVTEPDLRIHLALRGLPQDEINTLLETKKRQWTISPPGGAG